MREAVPSNLRRFQSFLIVEIESIYSGQMHACSQYHKARRMSHMSTPGRCSDPLQTTRYGSNFCLVSSTHKFLNVQGRRESIQAREHLIYLSQNDERVVLYIHLAAPKERYTHRLSGRMLFKPNLFKLQIR